MATPSVNLLPPDLRGRPRRARRTWGWIAVAAALLFALTAYDINLWLTAAGINGRAVALETQADALAGDLQEVQNLQRRTADLQALQVRQQDLRGQAWSQVWADLAGSLPAGMDLQQISTTESGVVMTCGAASLPLAAAAEDGLMAVPRVSGVRLASAQLDRPGHYVFTLGVALRGRGDAATSGKATAPATKGGVTP